MGKAFKKFRKKRNFSRGGWPPRGEIVFVVGEQKLVSWSTTKHNKVLHIQWGSEEILWVFGHSVLYEDLWIPPSSNSDKFQCFPNHWPSLFTGWDLGTGTGLLYIYEEDEIQRNTKDYKVNQVWEKSIPTSTNEQDLKRWWTSTSKYSFFFFDEKKRELASLVRKRRARA